MPYIRIFLLSIAFAFVIYFMYFLNTTGIENTEIGSMLGAKPKTSSSNQPNWNWCKAKPTKILWKNYSQPKKSYSLEYKNEKWLLNSDKINLKHFPKFDEWLKDNCKASMLGADANNFSRLESSFEVHYQDGTAIRMLISKANELLKWENQTYKAKAFHKALFGLEANIQAFRP